MSVALAADLAPAPAGVGVNSEVGVLRRVLLHRPGLELERLTGENHRRLLFDELPSPARARQQHDALRSLLQARGVEVVLLGDLLTDVLALPWVAHRLIAAALESARLDADDIRALAKWLARLSPRRLAEALIAGPDPGDLPSRIRERVPGGDRHEPVVAPLPNLMFMRDSSIWIGAQPHVARMALGARRRERLCLAAVYRYHPSFDGVAEPILHSRALEGGDVLVLAPGRLVVGVGPRTSPAGVERLGRELIARDPSAEVLVARLPRRRATMHLDTVLTALDRDTFTHYPAVSRSMPLFSLRRGRSGIRVDERADLGKALARLVGVDQVRMIATGGDSVRARREQWDDANNLLALAPGVVVGYEHNVATNKRLSGAGIEVLTIPGTELGRGRGGPRCLSCPIRRDPLDDGPRCTRPPSSCASWATR